MNMGFFAINIELLIRAIIGPFLHPLSGGSFRNYIQQISRKGISFKYLYRATCMLLVSFVTMPLRIWERWRFRQEIDQVQVVDPIFIVGHWRSGTTYIHNLMVEDQNLGFLSTTQVLAPEFFFTIEHILRPLLDGILPKTRRMDNMKLSANSAQEEEFAMGNICPYSMYHGWYFPSSLKKAFQDFVLFQGDQNIKSQWQTNYLYLLKKLTLAAHGKRLVLKNPANTGRIRELLEIFPNAKFIHIYRDPYVVYLSTKHLYHKILLDVTVQEFNPTEIEENIVYFYQEIMQKFFAEKELIPAPNLVEIKYEDFVGHELTALEMIYNQLQLPDFDQASVHFKQHIADQREYQKNVHTINDETIARVNSAWKFAIEKWQYNLSSVSHE